MKETELRLWDRSTKLPGEVVEIDPKMVKLVRQRFYLDGNGNNREGCVVEMREGNTPSSYSLANMASEARRSLGVIESEPKGSPPSKIF